MWLLLLWCVSFPIMQRLERMKTDQYQKGLLWSWNLWMSSSASSFKVALFIIHWISVPTDYFTIAADRLHMYPWKIITCKTLTNLNIVYSKQKVFELIARFSHWSLANLLAWGLVARSLLIASYLLAIGWLFS